MGLQGIDVGDDSGDLLGAEGRSARHRQAAGGRECPQQRSAESLVAGPGASVVVIAWNRPRRNRETIEIDRRKRAPGHRAAEEGEEFVASAKRLEEEFLFEKIKRPRRRLGRCAGGVERRAKGVSVGGVGRGRGGRRSGGCLLRGGLRRARRSPPKSPTTRARSRQRVAQASREGRSFDRRRRFGGVET
jgi:hypothetical protein